jgi:hypothetical protein
MAAGPGLLPIKSDGHRRDAKDRYGRVEESVGWFDTTSALG